MANVTIFDVARKAGVSKSTVSRVLNNKGNVNSRTRSRILKIIKEMNYRPNISAQSLVTKKTRTIGLVVPDITDSFFSKFIKGAEAVGKEKKYHMMLASSHWHVEEEWQYMQMLKEGRVDGILLISGDIIPQSYIDYLESENIPLVIIDRVLDNKMIPNINVDNVLGAYRGTKHLLELGHHNITFVTGPEPLQASHFRLKGFKKALQEYDVKDIDKLIYAGSFTKESGYENAYKILKDQPEITAIFYANDLMAVGGLQAIKELGLSVPGDISIMGCDDLDIVSMIEPPLTTLRQPRYKMGYTGMELLVNLLDDSENKRENDYPRSIMYDLELIVRASTDKPRQ